MSGSLQRIFTAERDGREKLDAAERTAKEKEAEARARADAVLAEAEKDSRELLSRAVEEAGERARQRSNEIAIELQRSAERWRAHYQTRREELVRRIVSAVLGEGTTGD